MVAADPWDTLVGFALGVALAGIVLLVANRSPRREIGELDRRLRLMQRALDERAFAEHARDAGAAEPSRIDGAVSLTDDRRTDPPESPPDPVRARDAALAALAAGSVTGILLALTGTPWRELVADTLVGVLVAYALARLLAVWRS